jgi:hypothetical protein
LLYPELTWCHASTCKAKIPEPLACCFSWLCTAVCLGDD